MKHPMVPIRTIRRGPDAESRWLLVHGFDGLACPEHECGCGADDMHPCGERGEQSVCLPAFLHTNGLFYLRPEVEEPSQ